MSYDPQLRESRPGNFNYGSPIANEDLIYAESRNRRLAQRRQVHIV
jgi:hypothetical protein